MTAASSIPRKIESLTAPAGRNVLHPPGSCPAPRHVRPEAWILPLGSGHQPSSFPDMPKILYTVRVTCRDAPQRGRFLAWLTPGHVMEVMKGGATAVRIVLPDRENGSAPAVVETQYAFPSRKAFDAYIRDQAPALRADGLKHFPPESGVTFTRQVAEIATEL